MGKATRDPVYMLFVQDGSGSMADNNKWTAIVPALEAIFGDMKQKADPAIGAGLVVFSDTLDPTDGMGPYPQSVDVPIASVDANQYAALQHRLSGQPKSGTPTQAALTGGYSELETFSPTMPLPAGGKKVLILITDGVPTDGCMQPLLNSNYQGNPCVQLAATKLAEAAPQGPVLTYVIGVGPLPGQLLSFDPSFLGALAKAGGTGPANCNPTETTSGATDFCYFQVDPTTGTASTLQKAFEDAINAIRGSVISCTFSLQNTGAGMLDPTKVNVTVDGNTVAQDPTNGWSYDDPTKPTKIVFNGTSCADLKKDPNADVEIVIGCETVKPPPPPPPPM
jgi:hypothetical protein